MAILIRTLSRDLPGRPSVPPPLTPRQRMAAFKQRWALAGEHVPNHSLHLRFRSVLNQREDAK